MDKILTIVGYYGGARKIEFSHNYGDTLHLYSYLYAYDAMKELLNNKKADKYELRLDDIEARSMVGVFFENEKEFDVGMGTIYNSTKQD